ncbi:hypothetical protein NNJEOMEG_01588 [Fundidesulfovibrio magnetotacticus]|uniref:Leucyl-tRNA synthetase n=2 Tax=Fundidesulfovibrio magnetotacticus TaxID=2730080 RepID=A0A6V8LPW1_9BACT|nr:hypothetical protein NNJEOMEG_01588 [Fundidesulfovibrio magnetotacticus]
MLFAAPPGEGPGVVLFANVEALRAEGPRSVSSAVNTLQAAPAGENVDRHIAGKTVRKVTYVPGKLVNVVVG